MFNLELYILLEGKLDVIKDKFSNEIGAIAEKNNIQNSGEQLLNALIETDPTNNKIYAQWLIYQFIRDPLLVYHHLQKIHDVLVIFDKFKHKLPESDIFRYKNISSFIDTVEHIDVNAPASNKQEKRQAKDIGLEKILNDAKYIVAKVLNEQAAVLVGKGTKWCVSALENNEFSNYSARGDLYFIYNKTTNEKYMLFFGDEIELKNAKNLDVDYISFAMHNKEVVDCLPDDTRYSKYLKAVPAIIYDIMKSDIDQNSKTLSIEFIKKSCKYYGQNNDFAHFVLVYITSNKNMKIAPLVDALEKHLGVESFANSGFTLDEVKTLNPYQLVDIDKNSSSFYFNCMFRYRVEKKPLSDEDYISIIDSMSLTELDPIIIKNMPTIAPLFSKIDLTDVSYNGELNRIANIIKLSRRVLNSDDCYIIMAYYSVDYKQNLIPSDIIYKITHSNTIQSVYKKVQSAGIRLNRFTMDNISGYFKGDVGQ